MATPQIHQLLFMVKDRLFKWIGIPSLGFAIPVLSGLANYNALSFTSSALSLFLFIFTSFVVWHGAVFITALLHSSSFCRNVAVKLYAIIAATAVYSFCIIAALTAAWQMLFESQLFWSTIIKTGLIGCCVTVFFSMVYEVLFLSKEREIDLKVVSHLDQELKQAEMDVLRNELDPHFVYNSLMPLYYLVKNDVTKAEQFAYKLIQVYQYFLENRHNDLISLREELAFINNYMFLLEIRYKGVISLDVQMKDEMYDMMILPFSLQILVENAIKHNCFDEESPLEISIYTEKLCLVVSNNLNIQENGRASSRIGLQNLRARYRLLCNGSVAVVKHRGLFIVKIPMIKNTRSYDISSYNRR
jgi:sensor histidine kinase YesM